jgi:hypothetical protein
MDSGSRALDARMKKPIAGKPEIGGMTTKILQVDKALGRRGSGGSGRTALAYHGNPARSLSRSFRARIIHGETLSF